MYLDEIDGIAQKYIEVLAKSEIYTSEDFLGNERADILTLKGFGEKTVDKITAIIMEAVEKHQAIIVEKGAGKTEGINSRESILEEVDNG